MTRRPCCYVCSSAELAPDADLRIPTCERCRPARAHTIRITNIGDQSVATCECGEWQSIVEWDERFVQAEYCRRHWRAAIAAELVGAGA